MKTVTVKVPVVEAIAEMYAGSATYPALDMPTPVRLATMPSTFLLHTVTDNATVRGLCLSVQRVVSMPSGCGRDEFKYDFPITNGSQHLLPAGTYDITICKQEVSGMAVGDTLTVSFMTEPVSDSFAMIYGNSLK